MSDSNVPDPKVVDVLLIIDELGGRSLSVNNTRVAGPKIHGRGRTLAEFKVERRELLQAVGVFEEES